MCKLSVLCFFMYLCVFFYLQKLKFQVFSFNMVDPTLIGILPAEMQLQILHKVGIFVNCIRNHLFSDASCSPLPNETNVFSDEFPD